MPETRKPAVFRFFCIRWGRRDSDGKRVGRNPGRINPGTWPAFPQKGKTALSARDGFNLGKIRKLPILKAQGRSRLGLPITVPYPCKEGIAVGRLFHHLAGCLVERGKL